MAENINNNSLPGINTLEIVFEFERDFFEIIYELTLKRKQLDELQEKYSILLMDKNVLEIKLETANKMSKQLQWNYDEAKENLETIRNKFYESSKNLNDIRVLLNISDSKLEMFKSTIFKKDKEIIQQKKEIELLQSRLRYLEQVEKENEHIHNLHAEVNKIAEVVEKTDKNYKELEEHVNKKRKTTEDLKTFSEKTCEKYEKKVKEFENLEVEVHKLKAEILRYESMETSKTEESKSDIEEEKLKIEKELEQMKEERNEARAANFSLTVINEKLMAQMLQIHTELLVKEKEISELTHSEQKMIIDSNPIDGTPTVAEDVKIEANLEPQNETAANETFHTQIRKEVEAEIDWNSE